MAKTCHVCGGNGGTVTPCHACGGTGRVNRPDAGDNMLPSVGRVSSPEFGLLHRSYGCISWHPLLGWLLAIGFVSVGPIGLITATDKTFFVGLTVVGFVLGALFLSATIRTRRLRLDLFDHGIVFHQPGGGTWSCRYSDIDRLFIQKGTIEGIKLALKNGTMQEAMSIREVDDAANFILKKM